MIIPVVFAVNDYYVPYLGVTLQSLAEHAKPEDQYHIYVLHSGISKRNSEKLDALKYQERDISVQCMDVSDIVPIMCQKSRNHLTKESYYRLMIPQLFSQYDKLIYLDSDIVVLWDLAELFCQDIGDKPFGVVKEIQTDKLIDYLRRKDIAEKGYFNAGVMLMNLPVMRQKNVAQNALEILKNDLDSFYEYMDQDALNILFRDEVFYLPNEWNFCWHGLFQNVTEDCLEGYLHNRSNPKILHYTSDLKPWDMPLLDMADCFWKYAVKCPFFKEIAQENMYSKRNLKRVFQDVELLFQRINRNERLALYGAGRLGQRLFKQIELTNFCKIVIWVDANWEKMKDGGMNIQSPEKLKEVSFDHILIAVRNPDAVREIESILDKTGIENNKRLFSHK